MTNIVKMFASLPATAQSYYRRDGERLMSQQVAEGTMADWMAKAVGLSVEWDRGLVHAGEIAYARDLQVCPPDHLRKFRQHVRMLLNGGIKPTPKALARLGWKTQDRFGGKGYSLPSGKYGAARRQELLLAGWTFAMLRWRPPMVIRCDVCGDRVTLPWPGIFHGHNEENYERHVRLSHEPEDAERIIREHYGRFPK